MYVLFRLNCIKIQWNSLISEKKCKTWKSLLKYNNTYPNNNLCLTPSHAHRVKEEMRESEFDSKRCFCIFLLQVLIIKCLNTTNTISYTRKWPLIHLKIKKRAFTKLGLVHGKKRAFLALDLWASFTELIYCFIHILKVKIIYL